MYNKFLIFILLLLITILAIFSINMEDDYNIEDEIDETIDKELEQDNIYDELLKPVQYNSNMRNLNLESFTNKVRLKDQIRTIWGNTQTELDQARNRGNANRHRGTMEHRRAHKLNKLNNRYIKKVKGGAVNKLNDIAQDYERNRNKVSSGLRTIALEVDPDSTL